MLILPSRFLFYLCARRSLTNSIPLLRRATGTRRNHPLHGLIHTPRPIANAKTTPIPKSRHATIPAVAARPPEVRPPPATRTRTRTLAPPNRTPHHRDTVQSTGAAIPIVARGAAVGAGAGNAVEKPRRMGMGRRESGGTVRRPRTGSGRERRKGGIRVGSGTASDASRRRRRGGVC